MGENSKPLSLYVLSLLSYVSLLAGVANGVSYGFGLVGAIRSLINDADRLKDIWFVLFLNLYGLGFAVMVVLVEIRHHGFYKHFPGFKNWAFRGLFLIFIGILSLGLGGGGSPFADADATDVWNQVREILAYCIFGIGMLYLLGEILCVRRRMQKTKSKYVEDGSVLDSSLV